MLLERLEDRRLLAAATEAFTGPSLSGLISLAFHGKDTAQAAIKTMLSALQTQLTAGPLADLNSSAVDGNEFITEVQSLVASFNQNVDQQLLPHFTHIDNMLKLQGQQVVANLVSLNQQSTVGLILSGNLPTQAGAAINVLTGGPIYSLNTPVSAYVTATQTFETNLGVVANALSSTATPTLTLPQVSTTIQAEAEAYRASMDAGLQVTHTNLSTTVNAAVTTLEDTVETIASANSSTAQADIHSAIAAFDSAILDTTGLFGLNGPVNQVNSKLGYVPHNLTGKQSATTVSVSGTATFGGTATLTATLKSATGTGLIGKVVSFTLDGAFAGTAVTDSSGVATLTGVTQNDTVSTPGTIVAGFFGDSTNLLSQNSGNLVVSQSSTTTTLTSSGTPSASGQAVTFTATVAAVSPGSGTPTGTVDFYDGTVNAADLIGQGTLNGVSGNDQATFTTSTTSPLALGTHPITAVYSGDTTFTTSTSSVFSQVVLPATTTTLTSSGTPSVFGQSVTFTATVAHTAGTGTPTGTVNFLDNGTSIGTGTLSVVSGQDQATFPTTTLAAGTHPITAVYAGDTNFATSTSAPFTQTVNQAPAFTSATSTTFTTGTAGSFTVTASGFPTPTFTESGALPKNVTLTSAGVLSGTPAAGTGGTYPIVVTATNSVSSHTQNFTLTVDQAPAITTSPTSTTFTVGTPGSFTMTATGFPTPTFTESGALPKNVTLTSAGVLSGTPAAGTGGTYSITVTATNSVSSATQAFTLTVS